MTDTEWIAARMVGRLVSVAFRLVIDGWVLVADRKMGRPVMAKRVKIVNGGGFFERSADGEMRRVADASRPDVWVCRRVSDFPGGRAPDGAAIAVCERCAIAIAFDPARLFPGTAAVPRICMQCAGIEPLPMTTD